MKVTGTVHYMELEGFRFWELRAPEGIFVLQNLPEDLRQEGLHIACEIIEEGMQDNIIRMRGVDARAKNYQRV